MTISPTETFAAHIVDLHSAVVHSIIAYPHPLHAGGIVVLFDAERAQRLELLASAFRARPPALTLHCLQTHEVGCLSLPGVFAPPLIVNEYPHLPYWLRARGVVLAGTDFRGRLAPPPDPRSLLALHLAAVRDGFRRYGLLPALVGGDGAHLAVMLRREMGHLQATALLVHGLWDIALSDVPTLFDRHFPSTGADQLDVALAALDPVGPLTTNAVLETAASAIWSFEQFQGRLAEATR